MFDLFGPTHMMAVQYYTLLAVGSYWMRFIWKLPTEKVWKYINSDAWLFMAHRFYESLNREPWKIIEQNI